MMLSLNVVEILGMSGAIHLYLTDSTISSYAGVKATFLAGIAGGNQQAKALGMKMSRNIAANPHQFQCVPLVKPSIDVQRYSAESIGIALSGKLGLLFASLSAKKKEKKVKPGQQPVEEQQQPQAQEEWGVQRAKPKRRPKRRARPQR